MLKLPVINYYAKNYLYNKVYFTRNMIKYSGCTLS